MKTKEIRERVLELLKAYVGKNIKIVPNDCSSKILSVEQCNLFLNEMPNRYAESIEGWDEWGDPSFSDKEYEKKWYDAQKKYCDEKAAYINGK